MTEPYPWPYDGRLVPEHTALLLIDWQHDFCGRGGYVDAMGYDISLTRRGIGPTAAVLDLCRQTSGFTDWNHDRRMCQHHHARGQ